MTDHYRRRWVGLVFISVAVSLIIVDSTIVNVAVPSIVEDLGISSTEVQWVQEAYTLVFASLLLLFGSLADRFGRKRLMLVGVVVFAGSSVLAALAPTGELLILARLVQGVGGAMIRRPNAEAIAEDRGHEVAGWIGDRSLTRPAFEELSAAAYDVLVVQPYVLIQESASVT